MGQGSFCVDKRLSKLVKIGNDSNKKSGPISRSLLKQSKQFRYQAVFCEVCMYPTNTKEVQKGILSTSKARLYIFSIFLIDIDTIANEFVQVQGTRNTIQSYNQRGYLIPKENVVYLQKKEVIKENPEGERKVHFSKPTAHSQNLDEVLASLATFFILKEG